MVPNFKVVSLIQGLKMQKYPFDICQLRLEPI